jgi:uroporphyrinogen-III synthase
VSDSSRGPLRGAGIVITRPARQAAGLANQVAAIGGTPLIFPTVVILPPGDTAELDRVRRELATYDAAIFVSANAVEYGVGDGAQWPPRVMCFAPGPGTAAALAAVSVDNVRVPVTSMDSEGLLALPELNAVDGKRVIIFRGSGGREHLGTTLMQRGARVDYVECYRRAKPTAGAQGLIDAWSQGRVDAVTVTSSEGLDNLWALLDTDDRARLAATPVFAPHPRIAAHARSLGIGRVIVTEAADAGLLAALLEYFAAHPTRT